jgi:tetratricopeptide (TPR) repeat protein
LLDQALEHANLAVSIGQSYGHHEISALGYHTLGNIHLRLEDYQSAIDYFERGFQVAGEHFVALELLALNGYALASAGQIEAGLEHLRRAYQVSSALDLGSISIFARSLILLVQNWQGNNGGSINEEIEIVLDDAKKRSIHRVIALLEMPVEGVDQREDDFIKKMEEDLQDVSLTTDPFFEMRMLYKLIVSKKRRGLSWQSEMDRMNAILEELAPRTVDMPYESAWQRYFNSVKTIENE